MPDYIPFTRLPGAGSPANTVLVLGGSIEQNEGDGSPLAAPAGGYPSITAARDLGPVQWASALSEGRLRIIKIAAAGLSSAQLLSRISNPGDALFSLGLNPPPGIIYLGHVTSEDPGALTPAQSAANDLQFYTTLRQTYPNALIILPSLPGVNIPAGTGNAATRAAVNPQRRNLAHNFANVAMVDFEGLYTNPLTGLPRANLSQDQIHPNPGGAQLVGQAIWNLLLGLFTDAADPFVDDYLNDPRVSVANGGWTIDALMRGGPGANLTATNWTFSGAGGGAVPAGAVRNLVARTDQYGNWQELLLGGTAGVLVCFRTIPIALPAGAVMQSECEVQMLGNLAGATDISLSLSNFGNFNTTAIGNQSANQGPYLDYGNGVQFMMRTPPATVPAGGITAAATFMQMSINPGVLVAGGIRFGRASLLRLA